MPKAPDNKARTAIVGVRLSPAELAAIQATAAATALPPATYLRQVGLAHSPQSKLDQQAIRELALLRADLGRVGGLLRMWLTNKERAGFADHVDVPATLQTIRRSEAAILAALERLVPGQ